MIPTGPIEHDAPPPEIAVPLELLEQFSWDRLFQKSRPVEVEIGSGKGAFLLRRARARPDVNLLGIEWANEFYKFTVDRMQRWRLPNVRVLRTDASHFIRAVCPRESISCLHIYHPDPWPKKRHQKRRLIQPAFLDAAIACLVPAGRIAIQTDHAEYFSMIEPQIRGHAQLEVVPFVDAAWGVEGEHIDTNFEIKYLREGRTIFQIAAIKR